MNTDKTDQYLYTHVWILIEFGVAGPKSHSVIIQPFWPGFDTLWSSGRTVGALRTGDVSILFPRILAFVESRLASRVVFKRAPGLHKLNN